jgi:general bacterial porin, GBP family
MRLVSRGICGAAMLCAAGGAAAQSSVTLYGVVDVFGQYLNNGGTSSVSMRSGGNTGSMFGLKGSEDLGGGLKAIFDVENGFNVNNGSFFADSTAMFYRQSWVGLTNDKYGQLTFGRQYQPSFWVVYPADPFRADEALAPAASAVLTPDRNTLSTQNMSGRTSNSIFYRSPTMGGFQVLAMYGLSATVTQPVPQTTGNMLDVAASYTGYGFYAGFGYQKMHPGTATIASLPAPLTLLSTEHFTGALAYRIGIVNLQALYVYSKPADPAAHSLAALAGTYHPYSIASIGATIQATPADTVEVAIQERNARGVHDNTPAFQVGYDHSLSKRTSVYARAGYMKNHGTATMSWSGVTVTGYNTSQTLAVIGMTHRF